MDRSAFIDAAGKVHTRAAGEVRIASFVPSITELVVELGLADRLVARTQFCIHPADVVKDIPAIGGTKKASLSKLEKLAPTHAILNIDENTREMAAAMAEFVPNIIVTHPLGPEDNFALYRLIGGVFGVEERAEALCADLDAALTEVKKVTRRAPPKEVVYFIWKEPWMTVSPDTYIARMLELVNWRCIGQMGDGRYPEVRIGPELLLQTDLFLFSSEPYAFTETDIDAFIAETGCPREKCRLIDGEYTSWYGSRAIEGLRYLARFAAV